MDTKKLRQKILDLAIHGKLVPQDPNDEPASVLLERIKAEKERLIKEGKIKRSKKSAKTSDTPHYGNVPFEVPEGWCITDIGELLINRDGERKPVSLAIRSKQKNKVYDYYGAAGVIDKVDNYLFDECLLLIGEDGANLLSRNKNNAFLADGKYWVNNHAHVLDTIDKFILSYVAIVINSMKLDDYITGSAQPKLSQDNLNKIPIFLPPLNEQKRIMTELERWFALIDQIDQGKVDLQETIKQTKSKILDLAIHGKLVPQDPIDEPAIELLKRINPDFTPCDNGHSRKFPQSWCSVTVTDVCSIIGGVSYNKADIQDTGIRVLRGGNIQNGKVIDCFDDVFIPLSYQNNDNQVQHGDIIVVASTGSQTLIGKTGFADRDIPKTQIGAFLRIVRPKQKALSPYIRLIFQTDDYKGYIRNVAKGSNINNVKNAHLQNYQIYLPPLEEQQRIVQKIEALFSVLDNIQNALEV